MKIFEIRFILISIFLCSLFCFFACKQESKNSMPITNVVLLNQVDSLHSKYLDYHSKQTFSMFGIHVSKLEMNNNLYYANLSADLQFCYIYDYNNSTFIKFKMPFTQRIDHIYFHNFDSIFVFFEREYVHQINENGRKIADFIIIDTLGTIKTGYSLDDVPYIYKGITNPSIMYNGFSFNSNMIIKDILYIPFSIFKPSLSDMIITKYYFKLMCAYNLSTHKFKMLNITIPKHYIGHWYNQGVYENGFDFKIANDSTIYYSFTHSSDIYKYDLIKDSSILVKSFPDFYFNNLLDPIVDTGFKAFFNAPVYSITNKIFLRNISIKTNSNLKSYGITQILDQNMNLIGYNFEDSIWTPLSIDSKGNLVRKNKIERYNSYTAKITETFNMPIDQIENLNPFKVKKTPQVQKFTTFEEYFKILKVNTNNRIILIPGEESCGTCLSFLLKRLDNENLVKSKKIKIIFFNASKDFYKKSISNYGDPIRNHSQLDDVNHIKNLIKPEEIGKILLISYMNDKCIIVKATPSNIENALEEFLK